MRIYYEKMKEVRYQDVYHKALVYCLGISDDTRRNIYSIYDFKTGCVKTECLHECWQTSGSGKVVRMAYNLYCNNAPGVSGYDDVEELQKVDYWLDILCAADCKTYPRLKAYHENLPSDRYQWLLDVLGVLQEQGAFTATAGELGEINIPKLICMADVEEKEVEWLIPQYMPKGHISILAGDGGIGKTTIWCGIVAGLSSGSKIFFEAIPEESAKREPQKTIFFSSEDSMEYTLKDLADKKE